MSISQMTKVALVLSVLMFCGIDISVIITWIEIFCSLF